MMVSCAEYAEYISAHLDGELSPEDENKLRAHLDDCHLCAALYASLTDFEEQLSSSMAEPPKALLTGVMAGVQQAEAPKAAPIAEIKKRPRYGKRIAAGLTAVAACAALAIFAAPDILDRPSVSGNMARTVDETSSAGGTEQQAGYDITFNADTGDGAGSTADPGSPVATDETDGSPVGSSGMPSDGMEYYAVVTVTGELPEILEGYEMFEKDSGTYEMYVYELSTVEVLESLGYSIEYDRETQSELSLVIYTP